MHLWFHSLIPINNLLLFFQLNITFNDKTEVFEYPSFESVDMAHSTDINEREDQRDHQQSSKPQQSQSIFKNSSAVVGSSGN